jgi:hypothetical protein
MVEKGARAALGIFDKKSAAGFAPDLGMSAGDDLGLERELIRVDSVGLGYAHPRTFREPTYTHGSIAFGDIAGNWIKAKGAAIVQMWHQADTV